MKNPPEGKPRAYLNGGDHVIVFSHDGLYTCGDPSHCRFTPGYGGDRLVPIAEWFDVNWDEGCPKYAMAPEAMNEAGRGYYTAHADKGGNACFGHDVPGSKQLVDACRSIALYKRTDDHPDVLVRVWEQGEPHAASRGKASQYPSPLGQTEWPVVAAGMLIPPRRIVVPEMDLTGDPKSGYESVDHCEITADGEALFFIEATSTPPPRAAARYSMVGLLLGYRTKDGWREVGFEPTMADPKCKHSIPVKNKCGACERMAREDAARRGIPLSDHNPHLRGVRYPAVPHLGIGGNSTTLETEADQEAPSFDARAYAERKERERREFDSRVAWGDTRMVRDEAADAAQAERGRLEQRYSAVEKLIREGRVKL